MTKRAVVARRSTWICISSRQLLPPLDHAVTRTGDGLTKLVARSSNWRERNKAPSESRNYGTHPSHRSRVYRDGPCSLRHCVVLRGGRGGVVRDERARRRLYLRPATGWASGRS